MMLIDYVIIKLYILISGIEERQEDIDVERIPDAVPRGDFKPIPPLSDPITMIALDLETTDVSE